MSVQTPTETPTPKPSSDYDAMASAFDELIAPKQEGDEDSTEQVEPKAGEPSEPSAAAATPPTATPPAAESTPPEPAAAGETPASPPAETPAPPEEDKGEAEIDWKAKFDELDARVRAAAAEPEPAKPEAREPEPEAKIYTKEEEEFLSSYEKEWPDVVKGEALKRRIEYGQIVRHVFNEIARVYGPLIEQGAHAAEAVADTTTLQAIREVHPDYNDAMYESIVKWADGLSGMKKRVVSEIISNGDPADVIDLVSEFKSVTKSAKPKVTAEEGKKAPVSATPVTEISSKAKQAAKAMSVVDSKRTSPVQPAADENDFDGAWAEAVGGAK